MKIGIDASRASKQNKTGVEWYAFNIINEIIKIGHNDAQFILYSDDLTPALPLVKGGGNSKIKILRWPFKFLWTQGRLSLEMLFNKVDKLFIPASAMPIIHPKNTITAIHDVGFMKYPEAYGKWQLKYLKWSTKFAIKHAKKIITISEFSRNEIIKYFNADHSKIFVTHLACDTEKFKVIDDKSKIQNVLTKYKIDTPYILFVGRLEKKKNIENIIKAFAAATFPTDVPRKLVLAGNKGYGWEDVEKLIKEKNLQNDIILTDYVPDEDLPYLYNGAELFLFPSLYEGFGMPILEAMACGIPVITSNTTSCPEVGGEAAVYVDPKNYQDIAEKITKVLNNSELRSMLRSKGLERVKNFSWEKCGKETLKILL